MSNEGAKSALPFRDRVATSRSSEHVAGLGPQLTLEQFASFVVEREIYASDVAAVRARYGVASVDAERALESSFFGSFSRDPEAHRRFDALKATYREWLLRGR